MNSTYYENTPTKNGFDGLLSNFSQNCSAYFVSEALKAVYCMLPKTGSTSWRFALANYNMSSADVASWTDSTYSLEEAAVSLQGVLTKTLCDYSQQEQSEIFEEYFKFVSVRHPLERLHSAYKQKVEAVEKQEHRYMFHVYNRRAIVEKTHRFYSNDNITFPRFVRYLTLENPREFDVHWLPYYMRCNACLTKFDYIANLETMESDGAEMFHLMNMSGLRIPMFNQYSRNSLEERKLKLSKKEFWKDYSKVPQRDMKKLLRTYRMDFEMYGYDLPQI